jgi:hypothetical protein
VAKKKSQKRKQRPEGVDPNELRRQKLEQRRQAKAAALAEQRRRQIRERWIRRAVYGLALLALVWFLFLRNIAPNEIAGEPVVDFSTAGAGEHSGADVQYESVPPVSGEHRPNAAPCGVHGQQFEDELMVHTLEHGAVGLAYDPTLDPDDIKALEDIVGEYDSHVFSVPYDGMESPISLLAWGHMIRLDDLDEEVVRGFIDEFRQGGDAPEANQACPNDQNEPFRSPTEVTPTPVPSPTATAAPEGGKKDKKGDGGGN